MCPKTRYGHKVTAQLNNPPPHILIAYKCQSPLSDVVSPLIFLLSKVALCRMTVERLFYVVSHCINCDLVYVGDG